MRKRILYTLAGLTILSGTAYLAYHIGSSNQPVTQLTTTVRADEEVPSADVPSDSPISQADAERIALEHVGEGRVSWIEREDDHGAAWEVEITRPDGREIDVYVSSDGRVLTEN